MKKNKAGTRKVSVKGEMGAAVECDENQLCHVPSYL